MGLILLILRKGFAESIDGGNGPAVESTLETYIMEVREGKTGMLGYIHKHSYIYPIYGARVSKAKN